MVHMKITGVMINYYFVCHRKLWYFVKQINMESSNENVQIGKIIDEQSYGRQKHSILIDEYMNIDFLKDWRIVHEVKKSDKLKESSEWQLKYYIKELRDREVDIEYGVIDYPKHKKRDIVYVDDDDIEKLNNIIYDIEQICIGEIPKLNKKTYCKSCAYYDLCYV